VEVGHQAVHVAQLGAGRGHRGMRHRLQPKSDSGRARGATTRTA
jgi:hypothetical protein